MNRITLTIFSKKHQRNSNRFAFADHHHHTKSSAAKFANSPVHPHSLVGSCFLSSDTRSKKHRLCYLGFVHRSTERERGRARETEDMSGGVARGRLSEERKAWRKNHPHVRFRTLPSLFRCIRFSCFPSPPPPPPVFCASWCSWIPANSSSAGPGNNRVSWRDRRPHQMGPWTWWFGIALYPAKLALVLASLTLWIMWLCFASFLGGYLFALEL